MALDGQMIFSDKIDTTTDEGKLELILNLLQLDTLEDRLSHGVNILRQQGDEREEEVIRQEITVWLNDIDSLATGLEPIPGPGEIEA